MHDKKQKNALRVLLLGDVVGPAGALIFQKYIRTLKDTYAIDAIIVNGENSGHDGMGLTTKNVSFFKHHGVDVITSGNHIWHKKEVYSYLDTHQDLLRPANFPTDTPGTGITTFECQGHRIGVINVQGLVFMRHNLACPFKTVDTALLYLKSKTSLIFIDFHAEATSEKMGLAYYVDGRVTGIVGTHTHVQTADARILPGGTAYITDLGMAGSLNSMIGMAKEPIIRNFITQMPVRFSVATTSPFVMSGVWIEADISSGKALRIERVYIVDHELRMDSDSE
ncbi:MAG: TIGR00282 family metallophosphoesterase [Candidatus Babeliales bacterium]